MPYTPQAIAEWRGRIAAYLVINFGFPRTAARAFARAYPLPRS